jgi:hypothetical protein
MTKVKIDKGLPMPDSVLGRPHKFPWREMEVSDSFVIKAQQYVSVRANMTYRNRKYKDRHFVIRKHKDGYRIWRDK